MKVLQRIGMADNDCEGEMTEQEQVKAAKAKCMATSKYGCICLLDEGHEGDHDPQCGWNHKFPQIAADHIVDAHEMVQAHPQPSQKEDGFEEWWSADPVWHGPKDLAYAAWHAARALPQMQQQLVSDGAALIVAERSRQIEQEGWTPEHDDKHDDGSLVAGAVTYALEATFDGPVVKGSWFRKFWMFEDFWFKPGTKIRMLVKAGALIVAEVDRLLRAKGMALKADDRVEMLRLERSLAYENACSIIDSESLYVGGEERWLEVEVEGEVDLYDAVRYLDLRGLIERHPENSSWIKIREESEAAR